MPNGTELTSLNFTAAVELDLTASKADSTKPVTVHIVAYSGAEMSPPGFGPVVIDLSGLRLADRVPLLADHSNTLGGAVGVGTPRIEGTQLTVAGQLSRSSEAAKKIIELHRDGFPWQASVGMEIASKQFIRAGESVTVNGKVFKASQRGLTVVRGGTLREVSFTPAGADAATQVTIAASKQGTGTMSTETTNDTALETERIRAASVPGWLPDAPNLIARAITEGWDEQRCEVENLRAFRNRTELENLRASRPQFPAIHSGGLRHDVKDEHLLAAAVLAHAGQESTAEKAYGEQVAHRARELKATSLVDICRTALQLEHRDIPSNRDAMLRAALSTVSLPVALGDAAHKSLINVYRESPATWRSFAQVKPTENFKTHHGIRPSHMGELEQLAKGGEIKHTTIKESDYTYSVDTFARMLTLDRRDIINDDLGLFNDTSAALGRSALRSVSDLVYSTLLANAGSPAYFSTDNSNYASGGGSALGTTSLAAGIAAMQIQRDADGRDLDIQPRTLLVPPELRYTATTLLESEFLAQSSANVPTGNPNRNALSLQVEPRLSNSERFSSTSTTAWYLFASPADAAIIVAFLNGVETPTLEFFGLDSDPNVLAASWRCYHDFGVALADYNAAYKSAGA